MRRSIRTCLALCLALASACASDTESAVTDSASSSDVPDAGAEVGPDATVEDTGVAVDTSVAETTVTTATDTAATDTGVTDTGVTDTTLTDTTTSDTVLDTSSDTSAGDVTADAVDAADTTIVVLPLCATPEGVGCDCIFDSSCASDLCLSNEEVCTAGCESDADCAFEGMRCGFYEDFLDVVRVCVPNDVDACTSCAGDDNCADGYRCIDLDDGKACARDCSSDFDCYSGTTCEQVGAAFGDRACVPIGGACLDCYDGDGDTYGVGSECGERVDCDDGLGGINPDAAESCNSRDDDCDGETDEDFDFDGDATRCGDCTTVCSTNHTTPTCDEGDCVVGPCAQGWDDCNDSAHDGCEVELATRCGSCAGSKNACGGCGTLEAAPGTTCATCGTWTCGTGAEVGAVVCVEPASCEPSLEIDDETVTLSGEHSFHELDLASGGVLAVGAYDGTSGSGTLTITATTITIGAGAIIDASGKGGAGLSPGEDMGNGLPNDSGPGGGYGGRGGDGATGILKGGLPFGTADGDDIAQGSNGASTRCRNTCAPCASDDTIAGGRGGGLVILRAEEVIVDGAILADGTAGASGGLVELGGGGGSGGGIWIEADRVVVTGRVSATGGAGGVGTQHAFGNNQICQGFGGSGGGGGRVKIRATTYTVTGTVVAAGGAGAYGPYYGGRPGTAGSIDTPAVPCANGFVDCDGLATNGCETELAAATCGACGPYPGTIGAACGICDSGQWACDGVGVMACSGDAGLAGLNACGGCADLAETVGGTCGGGCGVWECEGNDGVACSAQANVCGGCAVLSDAPGEACGTCDQGTWACSGSELVCNNADLCETNLVVDGQEVTMSGAHTYDNVRVINGGVLRVATFDGTTGSPDTGTAGTGTLTLTADKIEVDATSRIDATGTGGAGLSPGQSMSASLENDAAGGGGYGGAGGAGWANILKGGLAFGTATGDDLAQGSTGGETRCRNTTAPCKNTPGEERIPGGRGGGRIDLIATTSITIHGQVLADGAPGGHGGDVELGGGGGSGGGIRLSALQVSLGVGSIVSASGGRGGEGTQHATSLGFGGGGGGGGRIKVVAQLYAPAGTVRANGGAGGPGPSNQVGKAGAAGSIHVPPTP